MNKDNANKILKREKIVRCNYKKHKFELRYHHFYFFDCDKFSIKEFIRCSKNNHCEVYYRFNDFNGSGCEIGCTYCKTFSGTIFRNLKAEQILKKIAKIYYKNHLLKGDSND